MIVIFGLFGWLGISTWIILFSSILLGSLRPSHILTTNLGVGADFTFSSFWLLRRVRIVARLFYCLRSIGMWCEGACKPFILCSAVRILARSLCHNALNFEITIPNLTGWANATPNTYNISWAQRSYYIFGTFVCSGLRFFIIEIVILSLNINFLFDWWFQTSFSIFPVIRVEVAALLNKQIITEGITPLMLQTISWYRGIFALFQLIYSLFSTILCHRRRFPGSCLLIEIGQSLNTFNRRLLSFLLAWLAYIQLMGAICAYNNILFDPLLNIRIGMAPTVAQARDKHEAVAGLSGLRHSCHVLLRFQGAVRHWCTLSSLWMHQILIWLCVIVEVRSAAVIRRVPHHGIAVTSWILGVRCDCSCMRHIPVLCLLLIWFL